MEAVVKLVSQPGQRTPMSLAVFTHTKGGGAGAGQDSPALGGQRFVLQDLSPQP